MQKSNGGGLYASKAGVGAACPGGGGGMGGTRFGELLLQVFLSHSLLLNGKKGDADNNGVLTRFCSTDCTAQLCRARSRGREGSTAPGARSSCLVN